MSEITFMPGTNYVFGEWDAPMTDDAVPIEVPLDADCIFCGESFMPTDNGGIINGMPQHRECGFRNVMGGIGHHVNHARYCRSEMGPDAGLSRRESALLVWRLLVYQEPVLEEDLQAMRG